jgi:hypothetical protein
MNLDPNGLIFNTVTQFVEQVGCRLQWKYADLDNLVSTWNGPQAGALQFKPQTGTPHPNFPLMFCTDSQIVYQDALIAVIEATYQGTMQATKAPYYTPGILSATPFQGSRDFQLPYLNQLSAAVYTQLAGSGQTFQTGPYGGVMTSPAFYAYGTQRVNIRYQGENASVKFFAYPLPGGQIYSGMGKGAASWHIISQWYGEISIVASWVTLQYATKQLQNIPQVVPGMTIIYLGRDVTQRGKWYEITEHYGPVFISS